MGGGGTCTDDDLSTRVRTIAEALRRLGQTVNQPELKAIKALMLMRAGEKQSVAMALAGTTKPSLSKYRPLVDQVVGACAAGAMLTSAAAVVGPVSTGIVCGTI